MTNRDEALIRAALEMAADEWPKVRVEGGLATAAVLAYADRIRAIDTADVLAKVGAACPECGGTGLRDTGGVYPWGEHISVPCDCPLTVTPQPAPDAVARLVEAAEMPRAWLDVMAERVRQMTVEGWTAEGDDNYRSGQLAEAAIAYAISATGRVNDDAIKRFWPWSMAWWKPTSRRRDLVKAGALILAEIERLDRATPPQEAPNDRT